MKKLGYYQLGNFNIEVRIDPDSHSGNFSFIDEHTKRPLIVVGMDYKRFDDALTVLMHEATEFVYTSMDATFRPYGRFTQNSADRIFVIDHQQFAEATAYVSFFIAQAWDDFAREWKRGQKRNQK